MTIGHFLDVIRVSLALDCKEGARIDGNFRRDGKDFERWINDLGLECQESVKLLLVLRR